MRALASLSLIAFLAMAATGAPATADEAEPPTITVTGEGEVAVAPDKAHLRLGVEARDDSAARALRETSEGTARLIATLTEAGVAERDIQTAAVTLRPVYETYDRGASRAPEITGYTASNIVTARVADLDGLGGVLDALVTGGANRLDGLTFGLSDPAPALAEARRRAVAEARLAAETYAEAAGLRLGAIRRISDASQRGPGRPMPMGVMRAEAASVPVQPGELTLTAQVTVVWALDGAE